MIAQALLAGVLFPMAALAAPDEALLGKAKGYPACPRAEDACLVGMYSEQEKLTKRMHKVAKGAAPRELKRADRAAELGADRFMDANRNTGLLVLQGDTILAERYNYDRKPSHRFTSQSMAKTVVAMLVGIALHEQKIRSIDDPAQDYVPELKGHPYGATSLRHLLTMSSGIRFRDDTRDRTDGDRINQLAMFGQGPGGVATVLPFNQRERAAGTRFHYVSADSQVLGLVLRAAVGKPLAEYLSEKIWQPMGAEADALWQVDAGGYEIGYCCLNATLRDYGRLGMLLANGGALDGRQIIPADWVKAATTPESRHLAYGRAARQYGYGYQTWIIDRWEPRFALIGTRGQAVMIDPKSRIVVVHTAVHKMRADNEALAAQLDYFVSVLRTLQSKT